MAEKILNVRIRNKYDSYERWAQSNLVLEYGELAVAYTTVNVDVGNGRIETHPELLMKVGDGAKTFANLPWLSAKAADVPAWAKQVNPPTYAASDITGIDAYIADYVNDQMGISVDTDTQYNIAKVNDYQYKLQQKGKTDNGWDDVAGAVITIPNDTEELGALRALLGGENAKAVATQIADAIAALNLATTYAAKEHDHVAADITDLDTVIKAYDYITKTDAQGKVDALANGQVTDNKNAIGTLTSLTTTEKGNLVGAVNELVAADQAINNKIGTVTNGKTVVQMIADAQTAATYNDTQVKAGIKAIADDYLKAADKQELQGNINAEKGRIDTLVGTDTGKSARTIANEELAKQLIPTDAQDSLDTLAEIAAWIQDHPEDASAMNDAINALKNQLAGIPSGWGSVMGYVDDAISGLKINDYAKKDSVTEVAGRVTTLEGNVATWNAAEQNAKDYADDLNTAMDTRVKAVEGKAHEHANKALLDTYTQTEANLADAVAKKHAHENASVLDGITAQKVIDWSVAEQNAKVYADSLNTTMSGRVETVENTMAKDADLAAIAKSGNVNDLIQTDGDVLIFDCGDSGVATT